MVPCVVSAVKSGAASLIRGTLEVSVSVAVVMIISSKNLDRSRFEQLADPASGIAKKRMKTKPTRFTGWAGKNLAGSLATRRRQWTTIHGMGGENRKHVVRIEAPTAAVKRLGRAFSLFLHDFLHRVEPASIPVGARQFGSSRGYSWANSNGGWRWRSGTCSRPNLWRGILSRYFSTRAESVTRRCNQSRRR